MNRDEGTPVDEANMVGSELTLCPRRERNALNIQELESDITASGKVTAEDRELFAILKRADTSKNGMVSAHQAFAIFRDDAKVRPLLSLLSLSLAPEPNPIPAALFLTLTTRRHSSLYLSTLKSEPLYIAAR